ncbi:MAG: hypothetical protein HPY74_19220 [Firmicutes bacterium]|nr:hypothetical protein [Bacillota bacterium]
MNEIAEIGNLIRQKAHDLNNLIMVIKGNMTLMQCEDEEIVNDNLESIRACKEIINSLLIVGRRLNSMGAAEYGTDINSRR